jgi:hypothetical protein
MNKPFTSKQVAILPKGFTPTANKNRRFFRRHLQSISPIYGYQLAYVQKVGNKLIKHAVYRKK